MPKFSDLEEVPVGCCHVLDNGNMILRFVPMLLHVSFVGLSVGLSTAWGIFGEPVALDFF